MAKFEESTSLPPIHRVVTGHDVDGKSHVAIDGALASVRELDAVPGVIFHEVWQTHATPAAVDNGGDPTLGPLMRQPPKNGTRNRFVDLPPDETFLDQAEQRMKALFEEVRDEQGGSRGCARRARAAPRAAPARSARAGVRRVRSRPGGRRR
jgi:hypothetical protein